MQARIPVAGRTEARPVEADAPSPTAPRSPRAAAWLVVLVVLSSTIAAAVLDVVTPDAARAARGDAELGWVVALPGLALAGPAWLLLTGAPRNAVSWVLAGTAVLWATDGLAESWLTYALRSDPPLAGASLASWTVERLGALLLLGLPLLLLLYPEGRLPTGRLRRLAVASLLSSALLPALLLVVPSEVAYSREARAPRTSTPASIWTSPPCRCPPRSPSRCCGSPSRWPCWASRCPRPPSWSGTAGPGAGTVGG